MKNSHSTYIYILFVILLTIFPSIAFSADYLFSSITLSDGITNPNVKCVLHDSKDYLWLGTKVGLNKYDCGKIVTYKRNPALKNTLPDNEIIEIFEDSTGQIWIICSSGVVTYNRDSDNFNPVSVEGKILRARSHLLLPSGIVFGGAGNLYFYDYDTKQISVKPTRGGSDKYYTAIHPWTRDRYLLATRWDGMWIYNTKTGEIEPSSVIKGKRILASFIDSDGDLWISEYGNGISHFERTGKPLMFSLNDLDENAIVLDIKEHNGEIFFATDGLGVISYNKSSGTSYKIDDEDDAPRALRSVNCIYNDDFGHIYAGSVRGGLILMYPSPMKTMPLAPELEAFTVTSLVEDQNKVWIGIDGNGIILYEPYNYNHVTHIPAAEEFKIVSMDNFNENSILVSTYDNGLFIFDKEKREIKPAPGWLQRISETNANSGIPMDIKRLPGEKIALLTDKIFISDLNGTSVSVIEPGSSSNRLRVFYSDIGTLLCYNEQEVFNVDIDEETITSLFKLKGTNLECAVYDGSRYIYAGTSSGVERYDFETGEVTEAEPGSRMPPGSGVNALAYIDDKLWIGALGQLYMRNTRDGGIMGFGPNDGVAPNEFIYKAVLTTPNYILMGGVNGLLKINLNELDEYFPLQQRRPLNLAEVFVDGLPVAMNGNIAKLPDEYSTVKLRLAGGNTNPLNPDQVRFFVGQNKLNSQIETVGNTLTLGHLNSTRGGRYDIYASIKDINGQWTTPNHVGAILVPMAWWRKPMIIAIICVLAATAIILAVVYLYSHRRHKVIKRIEERRRQSLEKEVGFLMNLNYELRTPLTLIYSRLKLLTDNVSKGEMSEQKMLSELDNIYRSTGKMRDIINSTVDLWRSGDMKTGEILERTDVDQWIKEILGELKTSIHDKKLSVDTEGLKEKESMLCDLRRATIALLNVFRSVIDHAAEKTEITVKTKGNDEHIKILISFYNDESHGAGEELRYAGHLMALMDGELVYTRSENDDPSTIVMEFPKELKRQTSASGNLPGTEVNAENMYAANEEPATDDDLTSLNLSHLTVLVVEDDPELRELLVYSLSNIFNKVLEASNGKDALTFIKNFNPDLIITEARLPQMSGLELCRVIKKTKQYSHIPVIMLTTRLEEMSIANGNNFGADNYLTKPFDIGVLEKRCYSVLKSFDRVKQWYRSQASDILPNDRRQTNEAEAFILKVKEIIEENVNVAGFGVDDIVNKMLVSRSTLYSRFKELTGHSLGNYINDYKLNRAKELLTTTDMTMVDISDALGFTTQRYFSTFFKERTGMTPTAYRTANTQHKPDTKIENTNEQ